MVLIVLIDITEPIKIVYKFWFEKFDYYQLVNTSFLFSRVKNWVIRIKYVAVVSELKYSIRPMGGKPVIFPEGQYKAYL